MTESKICTCPSGDGSLRHPCPAHPAVEQAGGDERAVDGKPRATRCPDCGESDLMPGDLCTCGYETDPAAGYACSECDGSGDGYVGEVCRECDGTGWFVTPEQARAALAQPSPAQAEAEAERPEVVAYRTIGRHTKHQHPHYALNYYKQNAEDQAAHWRERGCEVSEDELMTVAQHERIVGELRAKLQAAEDRADTLEHRMMGMMTRHFAEAWRNRDTQKALDGYLSAGIAQLEQERDAALAEVERLRQFERICEGLPQDAIDGGWTVQGIRCYAKRLEDQLKSALARVAELTANRNRYGVDAHYFNKNLQRILRDFESFTPDELARSLIILAKVADEKVVAQHSVPEGFIGRLSEFLAQRGATGKALLRELRDMLAAAPARGQHSVPEEFSFEYRHPNGECHTVTVSREQVINEMPDFLFEALCSKFCNCEPVGETNVVECRCDEYAEEFKLLAAAPGKEGL
ncbi:TPA: hypothetical protein RZX56_000173 [Pseudomonas aeruginosa]|uniref:hypothetical protein n=1 Tax=Pseudomonas aeruginosa TaxID=287 RepID=UPI000A77D10F|nr:hypothetical protein [Pseudomonas aeruginosa]TED13740.1 hypothetical protein IPC1523_06055 [Pseudomonas aeruginosa]TEE86796.1 hypothetical protein IPC1492_08790 [Pseudomonas aeruginosa]UOO59109.1 hypothetical protein HBA20_06810 [Pseudomonas aeruginosa]UTQ34108.1 hypothetical protein MMZ71_06800 [Pseudomonas aeruginosa]HEB4009954.1 hypothetical protein [Pseudomonas aeruginosa]